jgi:hypothetical protein
MNRLNGSRVRYRERASPSRTSASQRAIGCVGHQVQRPFEPQPLHELIQRLAEETFEHAVEVEWGKAGCLGDGLETQGLGEVADDVVNRAVDALDVVDRDGTPDFLISSQDMASLARDPRACYHPREVSLGGEFT